MPCRRETRRTATTTRAAPDGAEIQLTLKDFRKYFAEVVQAQVEALK
jgi:hypothetical protein